MVTESYQKPKTPQIKFAGFSMLLFCHSELVSESKNEKLKQVQLDKKEKSLLRFLHVLRQNVNTLVFHSTFNQVSVVPN